MSKSAVKRIAAQLADEPREKLVEIIERQERRIEDLRERISYMGAVSKSVWEVGVEALKDDAAGQTRVSREVS